MSMHKASLDRLTNSRLGEIVAQTATDLAVAAESNGAPIAEVSFHYLDPNDKDCAGEYTVSVIVRVRQIGADD